LTLPSPCRRPARSAQLRWIREDSIPRIKASLVAITITDASTIVPCASRSRKIRCFEVSEVTIKRFNPAYGVKFSDMFYRAATFADKFLKGEKPGDIPIEQATKFSLVINLKTAKSLAVEIPPGLLARADEVIE
jgi:ABC-type uncharacterized transport system substrate-binding protein